MNESTAKSSSSSCPGTPSHSQSDSEDLEEPGDEDQSPSGKDDPSTLSIEPQKARPISTFIHTKPGLAVSAPPPPEVFISHTGKRLGSLSSLVSSEALPSNTTILQLGKNRLKGIPKEILGLSKLTHLNLFGNAIEKLPPHFNSFMPALKFLNLAGNKMTEWPQGLGACPLLSLDLSFNKIRLMRENIKYLTNLKALYLSHNKLISVPDQISNLVNLQILVLGHNRLRSLPKSISSLKSLQLFFVQQNKLSWLPPEFGEIPFDVPGCKLKLYKNPLPNRVFEALRCGGASGVARYVNSAEYLKVYQKR